MAESNEYVSTKKFGIVSQSREIEQFEAKVTASYNFEFLSRPTYFIEVKREKSPEGLGTTGLSREHLGVLSEKLARTLIKERVIPPEDEAKFRREVEYNLLLAAVDALENMNTDARKNPKTR